MAPSDSVGMLTRASGYSEQEVKATLDSCRLTYVYEPDWARLHQRVSQILSGGMLVAWFQGSAGRATLGDPSNRWARENVNRFLRQVPIDTPIPLVAAAGAGEWHDGHIGRSDPQRVAIVAECRKQLQGALDAHGCVDVEGVEASDETRLFELIRSHRARTGVPALIAVPFCASAECVCTPRDAVRTMFSSAIDVLVIERFVLAKDHWLLGMHAS